jgi:hypothetical protein
MEKHQTSKEVQQDTSKALKQKTNQDFNGRQPLKDMNLNAQEELEEKQDKDEEEEPETETPGIGDDQQTDSEKITMAAKERKEQQPYKPEAPVEEEPVTKKPEEIKGDDDAPAIVNERGSQIVNK